VRDVIDKLGLFIKKGQFLLDFIGSDLFLLYLLLNFYLKIFLRSFLPCEKIECIAYYLRGFIDEAKIYNASLSAAQISALYQNRSDLITNGETSLGDNWTGCITPSDGTGDGTTKCSPVLSIINAVPTQGTPQLNSTSYENTTDDNLTVRNVSSADLDSDTIKNLINWEFAAKNLDRAE